jgi:hypothetical protein
VLLEGFLSNVLNPKVAVFYLAFLRQFMRSGDWVFGKSMLLAAIHFVEGVILDVHVDTLHRAREDLDQPASGAADDRRAGGRRPHSASAPGSRWSGHGNNGIRRQILLGPANAGTAGCGRARVS